MANTTLITHGTEPFAQRVAKLLPDGQMKLFAASGDVPELLLHSGNYLKIPKGNSVTFAHELLKICLDRGVDTLVPLGKRELFPLAEAKQLFDEYGITILVPDKDSLGQLMVLENPPKQIPIILLRKGLSIDVSAHESTEITLSGIFAVSDSGVDHVLCCIAD